MILVNMYKNTQYIMCSSIKFNKLLLSQNYKFNATFNNSNKLHKIIIEKLDTCEIKQNDINKYNLNNVIRFKNPSINSVVIFRAKDLIQLLRFILGNGQNIRFSYYEMLEKYSVQTSILMQNTPIICTNERYLTRDIDEDHKLMINKISGNIVPQKIYYKNKNGIMISLPTNLSINEANNIKKHKERDNENNSNL